MSSENMQELAEDDFSLITPMVAPAEGNAVAEPQNGAASAMNDKPSAQSVHEQRVLVVRDINARIDGLENRIVHLTDAFGQSQEAVKASVNDLQHRSMQVMADVMRVSVRLEQSANHQADMTTALDTRLTASIAELGQQLGQAGTALERQQAHLDQIQSSHEALSELHEHLTNVTAVQGQAITVLTADTRQQFQISRTHIDGLNALYREQQQSLQALRTDYELLAAKSVQLAEQLSGLTTVVATNMSRTRKSFRVVGGIVATLAVLTLGLIAYFQLYPSAVPETVKAQLAGLSTGLHQQVASSTELRGDVTQLHAQVAVLNGLVKSQHNQITAMRAESRQMSKAVQAIRGALGSIQRNVDGIKLDLRAVQASVNAPAIATDPVPAAQ